MREMVDHIGPTTICFLECGSNAEMSAKERISPKFGGPGNLGIRIFKPGHMRPAKS